MTRVSLSARPCTRLRRSALVVGALAGVGAATVAWAALEAHLYELREVTVPVLAPGASSVRILQISDVHLIPSQADKIAWLRDLATLEPDFVVDSGDNFGHTESMWPLLHALEPLLEFPGAFVMGSNDYFGPGRKNPLRYFLRDSKVPGHHEKLPDLPTEQFATQLKAAGWSDVNNRRATVPLAGLRVALVGMDDPHINRDKMPDPDPADADADLRLGLVHAPYVHALNALQHDGADLILAGHTHGGQLCVPGFGALVTNCDIDRRRVSGLHGWPGERPDQPGGDDSTWLHVSAGVGTSPQVRLRFACRPSATLLTLVARP